jgi:sarcosine oxidase subunit gamma
LIQKEGGFVVELSANTPCAGLLPIAAEGCKLSEVVPAAMTLLSPYKGKEKLLSAAQKVAHGMAFAAPNRSTGKAGARCVWFGHGQGMLIGPAPDKSLARYAAVVDQSDGWAVVRLEGVAAVDVLARLTSLDLRDSQFKRGQTARSEMHHMMVSITRVGNQAFDIMAFRSMAKTLVHDLEGAMVSVAAQGATQ